MTILDLIVASKKDLIQLDLKVRMCLQVRVRVRTRCCVTPLKIA